MFILYKESVREMGKVFCKDYCKWTVSVFFRCDLCEKIILDKIVKREELSLFVKAGWRIMSEGFSEYENGKCVFAPSEALHFHRLYAYRITFVMHIFKIYTVSYLVHEFVERYAYIIYYSIAFPCLN